MTSNDWPFDQPRKCATLTMWQVLEGVEPILVVCHDEDDHGWQFLGASDANVDDARIVSLEEIVAMDRTVLEVADLRPGWQAERDAPGRRWTRRQSAPDESEDT